MPFLDFPSLLLPLVHAAGALFIGEMPILDLLNLDFKHKVKKCGRPELSGGGQHGNIEIQIGRAMTQKAQRAPFSQSIIKFITTLNYYPP